MKIIESLRQKWENLDQHFIITDEISCSFKDLELIDLNFLNEVKQGDVVALIGEFDALTVISFITLLDKGAIVVPLTNINKNDHNNYFEILKVDLVVQKGVIINSFSNYPKDNIIQSLVKDKESGIIFFSSGTSGIPKAIVHKTSLLLKRFSTPRKSYKTLNFLMFDHMGGINTLFHTIFNGGTIIGCKDRSVSTILELCTRFKIEVLPATPTFLRMLLMSGLIPKNIPKSIKIITYGTELMDQATLNDLCNLLPDVDFRQTYGLSEFSVLRVKSKFRNSLYMKIGGEGVDTKIVNDLLFIKSKFAMLGYINATSPFDTEGWYNTKDLVEQDSEGYIKIIGRDSDQVNVGGLKFMLSDVYNIAMTNKNIKQVIIYAKQNNISGQHIEAIIELNENSSISKDDLFNFFNSSLPKHMAPKKITLEAITLNHRLKKNLKT